MNTFALGAATVEIKAEFAKFRADLEKAKRETGTAADRMKTSLAAVGTAARGLAVVGAAAAAAAGGLFVLVTRAANAAEEIADMADKVGVSTERLQELRFAFSQNGTSIADVDRGLSRLNAGLGAFVQTGSGPAVQGLKAIGITSREAAAQLGNTEEAFDEIVERLAAIEDPARRAGAAAQLFGEEAGPKLAILIGRGGQEIEDLSRKAREMGVVLRDGAVREAAALSAQLRALGSVISTQMTAALIQLTPQIAAMAEAFTNSLPSILRWIEATGRFFGLLSAPIGEQLSTLRAELEGLNNVDPRMSAIGWVRERNERRIAEIRAEIAVLEEREALLGRMVETANTPGEITVPELPGTNTQTTAYNDLIETMRLAQQQRIAELRTLDQGIERQEEVRAAFERNRIERELLTAAERDGLVITEQLREEITETAIAAEMASVEIARQTRAHQAAAQAAQAQTQAVSALEDRFVSSIAQANSFRGALEGIARVLIEAGLTGLLTGQGAFGGLGTAVFGQGGASGAIRSAVTRTNTGTALTAATATLPVLPNANGNAFAGGRVIPFATGGVIGGPTTFPMSGGRTGLMGEAGPEAIMPLRRGPNGRLGIEAAGNGGAEIVVRLSEGLEASILQRAEGQSVRVVQQATQGPQFAARVAAASRDASNARLR